MYEQQNILDRLLTIEAAYVESLANLNPAKGEEIILSAGIDLKNPRSTSAKGFMVENTDLKGNVKLRTLAVTRASYIWEQVQGNDQEPVWQQKAVTLQAKIYINGLESGKRYQFRVATVSKEGQRLIRAHVFVGCLNPVWGSFEGWHLRKGNLNRDNTYEEISPCSHLALTWISPCSHLALTLLSPCSHLVPTWLSLGSHYFPTWKPTPQTIPFAHQKAISQGMAFFVVGILLGRREIALLSFGKLVFGGASFWGFRFLIFEEKNI